MFYCGPNVNELVLRVAIARVEPAKVTLRRATLFSPDTIGRLLCDNERHQELEPWTQCIQVGGMASRE